MAGKNDNKPTKEDYVFGVISNLDDRKKFKTTLATLTHYLQIIDDQKEGIKETVADLSANSGIDKKIIRKLANVMYKHNYQDLQAENEHFETLYEMLIEGKIVPIKDPVQPITNNDEDDSAASQ